MGKVVDDEVIMPSLEDEGIPAHLLGDNVALTCFLGTREVLILKVLCHVQSTGYLETVRILYS